MFKSWWARTIVTVLVIGAVVTVLDRMGFSVQQQAMTLMTFWNNAWSLVGVEFLQFDLEPPPG